jgi:hypothetical protein
VGGRRTRGWEKEGSTHPLPIILGMTGVFDRFKQLADTLYPQTAISSTDIAMLR